MTELIVKELENSQKILKDTIERFEQFGSLESKLNKANDSLEDNSNSLNTLANELEGISKTLLILLDNFKSIVLNFSDLDISNLRKLIKDSTDSYEEKIMNIEKKFDKLLSDNNTSLEEKFDKLLSDNNQKLIDEMVPSADINKKTQDALITINNALKVIKAQTEKKGFFS
jgi:ABC-type transporter Mla subunit MlaD